MAIKKFKDPDAPFKWKYFEGDVILWLVRWYGRYALSRYVKTESVML